LSDSFLILPLNIILFILAIIPIPLPYVLVDSMFKKIKQDLNAIVNLIIDASSSITGTNTLKTEEDTINNEKIKDEAIKNKSAVIGQLKSIQNSVNQEETQPQTTGGTRKIKRRNKYTKKYYLNRIHNTIKNFYKTNKTKTRFNKRRL